MDRDAPDSVADHLDLAGVNADPDLDSERLHAPDRGGRTPDGAAGTVEHSQETVAGRVNLASTETGQLATHEGVMALEELPPRSTTVLNRKPGRPTMSVNKIVARTRSGSVTGRAPVTNSWTSPASAFWSPAHVSSSVPASST
jgi:hypothetical protein